jgi:hypothetical protein
MNTTDKDYKKSNEIEHVCLNSFSHKEYNKLLSSKTYQERYETSQELLSYLCKKFKVSSVPFKLLNAPQRMLRGNTTKVYGFYKPQRQTITIYYLTAKTHKELAIKTHINTLIHEFIHHYDFEVLKLTTSPHTRGFYMRLSDLENKLKG